MLRTVRHRAVAQLVILLLVALIGAACEEEADAVDDARDRAFDSNAAADRTKAATLGPTPTPPGATATAPPKNLRYATASRILASFDQAAFTTTYTLDVTGRFPEGGRIEWSGPNCGTVAGDSFSFGPDLLLRSDDETTSITFRWTHPHPPCANASNHSDVTVTATMTEGSGQPGKTPLVTTVCTYPGSDTGRGPACQIVR